MSPIPSQLLKTWSGLTRWLLGLVLLAWVLLGLTWGALHWWIVPRIGDFRPQLEARASQALGTPVRVGAITARSNGMVPSFELSDVTLLDAEQRVALSLPRVLVALSPRSLWQLGFEQIYIDAPKLDVRRLADGRITVAGLEMTLGTGTDSALLDWFFSQIEFVIHDGVLRWTDEQRAAEPVVLQQIDVVVRNTGRHHDLRLDATPPDIWGDRFGVRGQFLQPLLSRQQSRWQDWDGQMYALFDRVDLSELRRYVNLGVDVRQGRGALRAWVDVKKGYPIAAVADVALTEVDVTLAKNLPALNVLQMQGRVGGRTLVGGFEAFSTQFSFDTKDGLRWPGGNVRALIMTGEAGTVPRGEVQADKLDLAALAQLVQRLPLAAALREPWLTYAPKGLAEKLDLSWQGPTQALKSYSAKGRLSQLEVAAVAGLPGVSGLGVDFELDQQSGRANVRIDNGSVDVPGILQESRIEVEKMAALARWQITGERMAVQLSELSFSNADAQGQGQIKWQTSDAATSSNHSWFPGVLDVQASLSRADATRVHRYLPLGIDQRARDYVRDALTAGKVSNVRFDIRGDISQLPSIEPRQGVFKISAEVQNAALAFVPRSLQDAQELPWPTLEGLTGQLLIDRMQLHVKDAHARLTEAPAVLVTQVDVMIPDLSHSVVKVDASFSGPWQDTLHVVKTLPLNDLAGGVLAKTTASGVADLKLKLDLPIAQLKNSVVKGSVNLLGSDVQITPDSPKITRARGSLNFTQSGLSLVGVQARMLGGDVRLDGGLIFSSDEVNLRSNPAQIRASGTVSAEGLRQATELGGLARMAQHASGNATYTAVLEVRRGRPELLVQSNLQGLELDLPVPLQKAASTELPFRLQAEILDNALEGAAAVGVELVQDRLSLIFGTVGSAVYERDVSGVVPRVLRGAIAVGLNDQESAPLPPSGVSANVKLPVMDLDAWQEVLTDVAGEGPVGTADGIGPAYLAYLPTLLAMRTESLVFGGRQFNQVVVGGERENTLWRANLAARELNGYVEYRQGTPGAVASHAGRLYARLARLTIAPSQATEVEALLDAQPASIPALDIAVDDFELRGKHLGRLEVEAINRMVVGDPAASGVREWRLNKFNLSVPEAVFTASGNWARLNAQGGGVAGAGAGAVDRRRTALNFKLDVQDGGALLTRLGMKDVVRQAGGKLEGQVAWVGSPLQLDYPTLSGAFTVNIAAGQFLKADPGIAKLFGVLSLQALPRRLKLDFRDVFSEGFGFDFFRGDVQVAQGIARTNNLQMKGVNAVVLMEGQTDLANETQDLKVVVVPEINAGTISLIASVINPAVGLGSFLAQVFLRRPLIESNTQELHVTGSWIDPQVIKVPKTSVVPKEVNP